MSRHKVATYESERILCKQYNELDPLERFVFYICIHPELSSHWPHIICFEVLTMYMYREHKYDVHVCGSESGVLTLSPSFSSKIPLIE